MEDAIEVMLILVVSCELKWTGPGEAKRFASIQAEGCVPRPPVVLLCIFANAPEPIEDLFRMLTFNGNSQAARGEQTAKSHHAHLLGVIEDLTKQLRVPQRCSPYHAMTRKPSDAPYPLRRGQSRGPVLDTYQSGLCAPLLRVCAILNSQQENLSTQPRPWPRGATARQRLVESRVAVGRLWDWSETGSGTAQRLRCGACVPAPHAGMP